MEGISTAEREFMFYKIGTCGSFHKALIDAIFKADHINQAKIALGFPEDVRVVQRFQNEAGYWEDLHQRWKLVTGSTASKF
jgi:hypothetical protein